MATFVLKVKEDNSVLIFAAPSTPGQTTTFVNLSTETITFHFPEEYPFEGSGPDIVVPAGEAAVEIIAETSSFDKDVPFVVLPNNVNGVIGIIKAGDGEETILTWKSDQLFTSLKAKESERVTFVVKDSQAVFIEFQNSGAESPLEENGTRLPKKFPVNGFRNTRLAVSPDNPVPFLFKAIKNGSSPGGVCGANDFPIIQQTGGTDLGDLIAIPP